MTTEDLILSRPGSTSRPDDLYLSRPGSTSRPDNFYLSRPGLTCVQLLLQRWLPEDTATEANSVNKADGVTSKEIVAVTSTDHQPSLASTDQQLSLASTEPSDPVSEPSLVVLDKRAKSKRAKKPAPTVRSPYTAEKKKDKVAAYNPFPPVNKDKLKELTDWLKTDP